MKRMVAAVALFLVMLMVGAAMAEEDLRGYVKGQGYQYVLLGDYPYEKDGTEKPVLWRILEYKDQKALLLTEYVIDTQQVIFETDEKVIEKRTYRRIGSYAESDLMPWMNSTGLDMLLGDDPIRNALIEEPGGGKFFILTSEQFLTTSYGFSADMWNEQKSRQASGTPYAIKLRRLYVDGSNNKSPYWASTIKHPEDYKLQLVGYNGHLSWGAYTRVNVGLRPSLRLDMTKASILSGAGTKEDPFILTYTGMPVMEVEAPEENKALSLPEETPASTPAPEPVPTPIASPAAQNEDEVLLSFLGDLSIGDSYQYKQTSASYHAVIDEKGYEWPFSLVSDYLRADDLTIANLEVVFTTRGKHTEKMYNLAGDPDHVNVLLSGSVEMVNTVNNHCMDFMQGGYEDSLKTLEDAGISHFGSVYPGSEFGYDNLGLLDVEGVRIGFIGFSYPQDSDQKKIASRIQKLKEEENCDLVIVSLHWGRETHMTPESWQMIYAKEIMNAGADVIWGHHPHVIQPIQFYKGKPILYSTGNFTFGTMSKVDPSTGIFQLAYEKTEEGKVQLKRLQVIPCETQGSGDYRPFELTDPEERTAVFKELVLKKEYNNCENPPASFLETGVIHFENGVMTK